MCLKLRMRGPESSRGNRTFIIVALVVVLVFGSILYVAFGPGIFPSSTSTNTNSTNPTPTNPTPVYTWLAKLTIEILKANNENVTVRIPPNVGLAGGVWANHTLDSWGIPGVRSVLYTQPSHNDSTNYDGRVYLSPIIHGGRFTVGDFFNIWGQRLNDTCISIAGWVNDCNGPRGSFFMEVKGGIFGSAPLQIRHGLATVVISDGLDVYIAWVENPPPP